MRLEFTKMQGIGNDFIVIDGRRFKVPNIKKLARGLCHRRFGIGADQILILERSRKADFLMRIYNADGSEAMMCGNGLRAIGRFVLSEKLSSKKEICVETRVGIHAVRILSKNRILVDMGIPLLKGKQIPVNLSGRVINRPIRVEGKEVRATCVSMGNPHCVIFVEDPQTYPVEKMGPVLEKHHLFPQRANVEFVHVVSDNQITMRVWERGAGETLACGSGACAAVVASILNGLTQRKVQAKLPGGVVEVEWSRADDHVSMTGPAEVVFKGEIEV